MSKMLHRFYKNTNFFRKKTFGAENPLKITDLSPRTKRISSFSRPK